VLSLAVRDCPSREAHPFHQLIGATTTALVRVFSSLLTGSIMELGKVFSTVEEVDELSSAMVCPENIVATNTLIPEYFSYAQLANLAVKRKEMCHSFSGADLSSCSKTESSVLLSSEQVITKAECMLPFRKCCQLIATSSLCNLGGDCSNDSSLNAVIISLKKYGSHGNSQHGKCSFQPSVSSEPLPWVLVTDLPVIKLSYNTYVPPQNSQSIDCKYRISKSEIFVVSSHFHDYVE